MIGDDGDRTSYTMIRNGAIVSGRMALAERLEAIGREIERGLGSSRPPPPKPEDAEEAEPLSVEPDPPSRMH